MNSHDKQCERVLEGDPCGCHVRELQAERPTLAYLRSFREGLGSESTPPETPYAKQRRKPESLLPPRAVPRASASASLITIACVVAGDDSLSVVKRAVFVAALSFVSWLLGYFTEPPRRRFRRDD